jgi:hypothetical protein
MSGDCKPAIVKPNYSKNSSGKKGSSGFLTSVVHTLRLIDSPGSLITFCHNFLSHAQGQEGVVFFSQHGSGCCLFVGLAHQGKDIVFRFIIEFSSLRDFGPLKGGGGGFFHFCLCSQHVPFKFPMSSQYVPQGCSQ